MITIKGKDIIITLCLLLFITCSIFASITLYNDDKNNIPTWSRIPFVLGVLGLVIIGAGIIFCICELLRSLSKKEFKINVNKLKQLK